MPHTTGEKKKWQVIVCLRGQTRSELPFGHTVDCEMSAKQKSLFKRHVMDHCFSARDMEQMHYGIFENSTEPWRVGI